jgi:DNA-binding NarL/FixJ family response regulator
MEEKPAALNGSRLQVSVLIADDHRFFLQGVEVALKRENRLHLAGMASNGQDLRHFLEKVHPDVLVLDLNMPGFGGMAEIPQLLAQAPRMKIIVLTAFSHPGDARRCLELGARGYLDKSITLAELFACVQKVHRGEIVTDTPGGLLPPELPRLTKKQKLVLCLTVRGNTNRKIAALLKLSEGTIEFHQKNLIAGFGVDNRAGLVAKALDLGFCQNCASLIDCTFHPAS